MPALITRISFGCILLSFFLGLNLTAHGQIQEIRRLQRQLPSITDSIKYVDALNRIGLLIHTKSADSCFDYGKKARVIADRLHYTKGQAAALTNIAITLTLKGLYSQSLTYYITAYGLFNKARDKEDAAQLLMNCAITYDFLGNKYRSLQFAKKALNASTKLHSDSVVSMLLVNYVNLDHGLSETAVQSYLHKAQQIAGKYKDIRTQLFLKQVIADGLLTKGKNEAALPYILQSIQMAKEHQWEYHEMEGLSLHSTYFIAVHKIDSAINCYQVIYSMALKDNYVYWQIDVLQSLLAAYEQKHDVAGQLKTNKLLVKALQQNNDNNNNFVGDYIVYNKAQEDLNNYKTQYYYNRRQTAWLTVMVLIVASVSLLLFLLYANSRRYGKTLAILNQKVNKQNEELQQADEFKNRLISMLAHDFRAPLGSAIAMMSLVKDNGDIEKEELEVLHNSVETDMQNILLTFDNILQWTKKQLSGFVYEPRYLSINKILDEAASMFKDTIQTKNITIINKSPVTLNIITDKEIIQFVNRNLIHNAIKFSPQGKEIILNASHVNNEIIISVEDNGNGISPEKIKSLFTYNNTAEYNKGAGIALTICKEFINKLHGRIWAENKKDGGTIFYYALPDDEPANI